MSSGESPELEFATGIDPATAMWVEARMLIEQGKATGDPDLQRKGALKAVEAISFRLDQESIDLCAESFPSKPIPAEPLARELMLTATHFDEDDR